jgi:uncharacterized protein YlxW (UPF0749 family)
MIKYYIKKEKIKFDKKLRLLKNRDRKKIMTLKKQVEKLKKKLNSIKGNNK